MATTGPSAGLGDGGAGEADKDEGNDDDDDDDDDEDFEDEDEEEEGEEEGWRVLEESNSAARDTGGTPLPAGTSLAGFWELHQSCDDR